MKNKAKLALTCIFLALPFALRAQFNFSTNADNTMAITGYFGPGGVVSIPTNINGLTVTVVGVNAFNNKTTVTSVTVPNTVTNIGKMAFQFCSGLTSITLGTAITSIGSNAFYDCPSLTNITLPASVTNLGVTLFVSCAKLTNIAVDPSNPAFTSTNGILFDSTRATLVAFPGGRSGSYSVPSNVTDIAYGAFLGAPLVTSISLSQSVTNISNSAFAICTALTNIAVDASNPAYSSSNGVLFDKAQTILLQCPGGFSGGYVVSSNVTAISAGSFAGCIALTSINLPNGITSIPNSAFYFCTNLASVTIPDSVTNIDTAAFEICLRLASVAFGSGVQSIGDDAFIDCGGLTRVSLPTSVTSIGGSAFSECGSLTNVTILGNLTNIASAAFLFSSSLRAVYFAGNAPPAATVAFEGDPVTVYYLPGTIGWGSTYSGAPAVLWNPQALSPRLNVGQFQFDITGPSNSAVVITASGDLSNPTWVPVATNALSASGTSTFTDPQSGSLTRRFYRFRSP